MTEQIEKDRKERVEKCRTEIEASLRRYELALGAEDMIGQKTKIIMELSFMDLKKYDTSVAQEEKAIIDNLLDSKGDKIK